MSRYTTWTFPTSSCLYAFPPSKTNQNMHTMISKLTVPTVIIPFSLQKLRTHLNGVLLSSHLICLMCIRHLLPVFCHDAICGLESSQRFCDLQVGPFSYQKNFGLKCGNSRFREALASAKIINFCNILVVKLKSRKAILRLQPRKTLVPAQGYGTYP